MRFRLLSPAKLPLNGLVINRSSPSARVSYPHYEQLIMMTRNEQVTVKYSLLSVSFLAFTATALGAPLVERPFPGPFLEASRNPFAGSPPPALQDKRQPHARARERESRAAA